VGRGEVRAASPPSVIVPPDAPDPAAEARRAAGETAARMVEDGMRLGLGTGSTAAEAIAALGRRIREDGLRIAGVPTSFSAERLARRHGVPLLTLDDLQVDARRLPLDIALDGADEVGPELTLIKGRGGAHTRERVVAALAERFVVLADESKLVERMGTRSPVPVETLPMATPAVAGALRALGAEPVLREGSAKDGPVVTDQGFWILDAHFRDGIDDPGALASELDHIPGLLDHGLFVGMATEALIGRPDGGVSRRTADANRNAG
jgi:ribose 5-phosphate isomerase A